MSAVSLIAGAILVYAVLSEILAIYALYQQQAESGTGQRVLQGVILLIIATATGPALTFSRYYIRTLRALRQGGRPHPADTSPDAKA